ncbi:MULTISPECIES: hypothetical protein [unclassified Streptomyces]|uniref:hypothetical protein n=1 Tax=unclassified Streptomyces TaxID=2593676 RepID=UPI002741DD44|nr:MULTISPECIES: hypothetical protein [unclassified Streptomyces]
MLIWHPLAKLWQDTVAGDRWAKEYDAAAFAKDLTDNSRSRLNWPNTRPAAWTRPCATASSSSTVPH